MDSVYVRNNREKNEKKRIKKKIPRTHTHEVVHSSISSLSRIKLSFKSETVIIEEYYSYQQQQKKSIHRSIYSVFCWLLFENGYHHQFSNCYGIKFIEI